MKITVPLVLCLTGSAALAEPDEQFLVQLPKRTLIPRLVDDDVACTRADDRIRVDKTTLGQVSVLHQCGADDVSAELAFDRHDGWQIYTSATIRFHDASSAAAPTLVRGVLSVMAASGRVRVKTLE